MSESLRKELAGTGVKVTNVLPGVIVITINIITINTIFIITIIIGTIIMVMTLLSQGC